MARVATKQTIVRKLKAFFMILCVSRVNNDELFSVCKITHFLQYIDIFYSLTRFSPTCFPRDYLLFPFVILYLFYIYSIFILLYIE